MAKKEAKTAATKKKVELGFKAVKLVYSTKSPKTGHWRFSEKLVKIPSGQDDIKFLEQEIKKA
ncbi:MAG: hypothetical protein RMI34_11250 [Chloroherpetonaceae bacterium]|nr:hypothetical protein [Chloroherpetonaceae bacterium]MCS7211400.1 hypothetical protein [Chloroherpetonaceae bacterium]MDW8020638.1 hypothetical protein [Chloroherpetonaceae bacterium]MDW8465670.1 hypothetical protein [Chloroherpetonaceae bacterium]